MVSDCLVVLALYLVGHLAGIDQLLDTGLDDLCALGYLLDDVDVAGGELLALVLAEDVDHVLHILCQLALIVGGDRDDMVHGQVAHHTGLDLYLLGVGLPLHLVASLELVLLHHAHALEHLDGCWVEIALEDLRTALLAVESALGSLFHPLVAVTVAVETDRLAGLDVLANDVDDG